MAKKIKGQGGKRYKIKKPFYKRVWVWVLSLAVLTIFVGALSSSNRTDEDSDNSASNSQEAISSESSQLNIENNTEYSLITHTDTF